MNGTFTTRVVGALCLAVGLATSITSFADADKCVEGCAAVLTKSAAQVNSSSSTETTTTGASMPGTPAQQTTTSSTTTEPSFTIEQLLDAYKTCVQGCDKAFGSN